MTARQLTKEQILALPPACMLADLAGALGVSEPTIRAAVRSGELERLGIRVNRLGAQYRVVTATVWAYLGLQPDSTKPSRQLRRVSGGGAHGQRRDGAA